MVVGVDHAVNPPVFVDVVVIVMLLRVDFLLDPLTFFFFWILALILPLRVGSSRALLTLT